ncbi:MAG: hypothetical protein IPQ27_08090 [Chitinophagaceae bacterium]|nr:hypothetical protein [Chitinophagaceae bacterium]
MKHLLATSIFLFLVGHAIAQNSQNGLSGIWKGYIKSTERKIPYELVISSNDGVFSGYSYTTFGVKSNIVTMKKVLLNIEGSRIIVYDDSLLYNTIQKDLPRQIVQVNTLELNGDLLTGSFVTQPPPGFKTAKGNVYLEKQSDKEETRLVAKLEEMELTDSISFLQKPVITAKAIDNMEIVKTETPQIDSASVATIDPGIAKIKSKEIQLNKTEEKSPLVNSKPAAIVVVKQPIAKPKPANPPVAAAKPKPAIIAEVKQPAAPPAHKPIAKHNTTGLKVDLSKRKIETIDELVIESDSLQISLYDNGEVDGDTVSIILNGQAIVSRQGLSASAFRKTIYITPELGDSIQLVMYAENLGSLPPNSGLLIVDYDNRRKEIRFSGDLSKNAAITLKRKKK